MKILGVNDMHPQRESVQHQRKDGALDDVQLIKLFHSDTSLHSKHFFISMLSNILKRRAS